MLANLITCFKHDEDGAVTVDWVVLTSAIILMTIGMLVIFKGAMSDSGDALNSNITNAVANALS